MKVLLLKMKADRGGFWQPVTGHVEESEDFAEAALREAQEETGFSFERIPQYLGMEYHFQGRFGPVIERAYTLCVYSEIPPKPILDANEHVAYQWVSPEEALQFLYFPSNKEAVQRATSPISPILLNRDGAWIQDGEEISHVRTAELLHQSLVKKDSGYFVHIQREEAEVIVEDAPRFVEGYDCETGMLRLKGHLEEELRPETLRTGKDNILYCTLANGWTAKFLSPAYYRIAREITELNSEYIFHFRGRDYRIAISK